MVCQQECLCDCGSLDPSLIAAQTRHSKPRFLLTIGPLYPLADLFCVSLGRSAPLLFLSSPLAVAFPDIRQQIWFL